VVAKNDSGNRFTVTFMADMILYGKRNYR